MYEQYRITGGVLERQSTPNGPWVRCRGDRAIAVMLLMRLPKMDREEIMRLVATADEIPSIEDAWIGEI